MKKFNEDFSLLAVQEFNTSEGKILQVACYFTLYSKNVGLIIDLHDKGMSLGTRDCPEELRPVFETFVNDNLATIEIQVNNFLKTIQ